MKLVIGLGNPGSTYEQTRHNIGFCVVDRLAAEWHIPFRDKYKKAWVGEGTIGSEKIVLAKPLTWMNLSGESVQFLLKDLDGSLEDLMVVHDDIDLPLGALRWVFGASDGGHNGVKSIIGTIGNKEFVRLRCGVGRPKPGENPADYVLQNFSVPEEQERLIVTAGKSVAEFLQFGLQWVQQKYHTKSEVCYERI